LNAPGNSAPHAATEMNFGLPSAASGRLARHGRPGPGATYLRTAINTCGIALPCGDRNEFRSTCRRGAGADAGCGRVRRNSFRHGLGEDMGRAKGCAEIHFGMGWGRTRGERKGAPKFIMGWGRTWGDRNKFRSTGRRGAGADAGCGRVRRNSFRHGLGEDMGRARGCAEIYFGMGCEQKRGDRNKFRSPGRRGAGADAGCGRVRRNSFRHGLGEDMGRARGCAEIYFGMGCEQKRGDRNKFRSPGRRGAGADAGCGRVRRNSFRHGLGEDMGRAKGCAEIHFGMGWGRTRGDREGAPKFISAWVVSRSGVTEINFGHRAGAGRGRTRGAAGFAEIHFGMGWGRTWGERKGAPKFIMGWGRTWGDREGAPKFISAWVVGRSGVTEMNFGQHAGAGQGRTRGAAGCAEIHFGMGWGRTRGERKGAPKFISAWVGGGQGATEINFGQHAGAGRGRTRGERKGAPKFISAWVGGGQGATEINFGLPSAGRGRLARHGRPGQGSTHLRTAIILNLHQHHTGRWRRSPHTEDASCPRPISRTRHQCAWTEMGLRQWSIDGVRGCRTCRSPAPSRSAQTRSGATV
jgi:hypothetical protein